MAESAGGAEDSLASNTSKAAEDALNGSQPPAQADISDRLTAELDGNEGSVGEAVEIKTEPRDVLKGGGDASGMLPDGKKRLLERIPTITIDDSFVDDIEDDDDECIIIEHNKPSPPVITIDDSNVDMKNQEYETMVSPSAERKRVDSQNDNETESEKKTEIKKEMNGPDDGQVQNNHSQYITSNASSENIKLEQTKPSENSGDGETETASNGVTSPDVTKTGTEEQGDSSEDDKKEDGPLDILGNGLLLKKVINPGDSSIPRAINGDRVTVQTVGRLENGTIVDINDNLTFTLGDGDVVQAWDLCVSLMHIGEVCELVTDSKYAYGKQGRSPDVLANAKITYTIELQRKEEGLDISNLTVLERLSHGNVKRERGNYLFGRNDFTGSINSYSKALKILEDDHLSHSDEPSLLQELVDVRMKCYNNMAAAQLKVDAYDAAVKSCDAVLKVQPDNVKALFRKGKSLAAKGETQLAVTVLRKASKLDPESKIVHQELFKLTKKLKKETESEKDVYRKMFGQNKPSSGKNKNNTWKTWGLLATGALSAILLSVGIAVYRNMNH